MRINKYISDTGICSRREADKLIQSGKVTINGKRAALGDSVEYNDKVLVDGKPLKVKSKRVYIVLNKPVGITCTTELHIKENIVDFVGHKERIFPIGRLDKDSEGLIILTNDGDIVNKVLRSENNHEKEYIVTVNKLVTDKFISNMGNGVNIEGKLTKKCKVERISDYTFRIILTEGRNRQIRKMSAAFGYEVKKLKRIRIMNILLGDLKKGKWRDLTKTELTRLFKDIDYNVEIP
ncbi:23S rRNA pseudouridine(2604) synthase RluF [Clostridium cylindrosporum]|uniref:Pseudouridine synthase n=1 Tax=Clostridium cylindrosporum DSM 605 TaxID=1121307 RepID=A0A0J8G679_CLOCY|nr:ribosomal large subunit pseudouridine synthase F [Clostridium cylindrosporum DSM 605]